MERSSTTRRSRKAALVNERGGRCADCAGAFIAGVFDLHHRDPREKGFDLGQFTGGGDRAAKEVEKCDLLCANCHRVRHLREDSAKIAHPVVTFRRRRKARAVAYMGGRCVGCGGTWPDAVMEFHHRDPLEKSFGISVDGIARRWEVVVAELAKCVMLCANCHREVHAGVRKLDDGHPGLAETAAAYRTAA